MKNIYFVINIILSENYSFGRGEGLKQNLFLILKKENKDDFFLRAPYSSLKLRND